jgi:hypothetical protein
VAGHGVPAGADILVQALRMPVPRAEREGFEPSDPVTQVNSLAVNPIRPLSHLSLPPSLGHRATPYRRPLQMRNVLFKVPKLARDATRSASRLGGPSGSRDRLVEHLDPPEVVESNPDSTSRCYTPHQGRRLGVAAARRQRGVNAVARTYPDPWRPRTFQAWVVKRPEGRASHRPGHR